MVRQGRGRFVVQEHKARRLHYDFRLEIAGVLKSWAVPKGPSMDPARKRLSVQVEDHPLEHMEYEGIIPEGSYGAGPVVIWDRGLFEAVGGAAEEGLSQGRLSILLEGEKLQGAFTLLRLKKGRDSREWLLFKNKDAQARPGWSLRSALTPERLSGLEERVPPCGTAS